MSIDQLKRPVGAVTELWTLDRLRYLDDVAYRDQVAAFLEQHFAGRCPRAENAHVLTDEAGHRVVTAECWINADGAMNRAAPVRATVPMIEGTYTP